MNNPGSGGLLFENCHLLASDGSYARLTRTCEQTPDGVHDCAERHWIPREAKFNGVHRFINFAEVPLDITAPCRALLEPHFAHAVLEAILPVSFLPITKQQMRASLVGSDGWAFAMLYGLFNNLSKPSRNLGQTVTILNENSFRIEKEDMTFGYSRSNAMATLQKKTLGRFINIWFNREMSNETVAERLDLQLLTDLTQDGSQTVIVKGDRELVLSDGVRSRFELLKSEDSWIFKLLTCEGQSVGESGLGDKPTLARVIEKVLERFNRRYNDARVPGTEMSLYEQITDRHVSEGTFSDSTTGVS